jgi:hypothetical protein
MYNKLGEDMQYIPTTHQFVAVLSKKATTGRALNALGHMAAGLVALHDDVKPLRFQTYTDKDGGKHPSISDSPFIVLSAKNSNQIRTLRNNLTEKGIKFTDFTEVMTGGNYADQHNRMQNTAEADLEYLGVCFFMNATESKDLTKKFSLYT